MIKNYKKVLIDAVKMVMPQQKLRCSCLLAKLLVKHFQYYQVTA